MHARILSVAVFLVSYYCTESRPMRVRDYETILLPIPVISRFLQAPCFHFKIFANTVVSILI